MAVDDDCRTIWGLDGVQLCRKYPVGQVITGDVSPALFLEAVFFLPDACLSWQVKYGSFHLH